jgi:LacI family transcriptional regulator
LGKVTMQQIAEQLGVSKFAVSQALSGKPGVGEETRNRIIQAATAQGYFSQRHTKKKARSAIPTETDRAVSTPFRDTVIVLMPNVRFQIADSYYWGKIVDGVVAALAARNIGTMVVTEHNSDRFLHIIDPSKVLGLIGIGYIAEEVILEIRKAGLQFVLIDHEDALIETDTVFMNNFDSMRKLTEQLIYRGHHRLLFVGYPAYSRSFSDRWLGYRTVLEEKGLAVQSPSDRLLEDLSLDEMREVLTELRKNGSLPTVLVCGNDHIAQTVMQMLSELGVQIPFDVSVTGFDNMDYAVHLDPPLMTVDVPKEAMGQHAVEILLARLHDPDRPIVKTLLHGQLITRMSVTSIDA